jgi:hypothetical protein
MMQLASTSMESLIASVGFQLRQGKSIVTLYMGFCAALYNGTIQ